MSSPRTLRKAAELEDEKKNAEKTAEIAFLVGQLLEQELFPHFPADSETVNKTTRLHAVNELKRDDLPGVLQNMAKVLLLRRETLLHGLSYFMRIRRLYPKFTLDQFNLLPFTFGCIFIAIWFADDNHFTQKHVSALLNIPVKDFCVIFNHVYIKFLQFDAFVHEAEYYEAHRVYLDENPFRLQNVPLDV